MTKMHFKLDTVFHILFMKCMGITQGWGISDRILDISLSQYYDDGCIEFNTNIGLESIDILYNNTDLTKSQYVKLSELFKSGNIVIDCEVE